jgi:hypothetical protein
MSLRTTGSYRISPVSGLWAGVFGAGGGGRTHMLSEERGILSPLLVDCSWWIKIE